MTACGQELCSNWDGHSCPCRMFGIGPFSDGEDGPPPCFEPDLGDD